MTTMNFIKKKLYLSFNKWNGKKLFKVVKNS